MLVIAQVTEIDNSVAVYKLSKKFVTRQCHKMNQRRGRRMLEGGKCGLEIKGFKTGNKKR